MNYSIIKELGIGGMATVYLAEHKLLKNKVALKVLSEELVRNKNIRNRFLAEARNLASMSHPNIIKVTDLIDEGDTVAFVMELVDGETLKDFLDKKGKLNDDEIKDIFSQMLEAVGYVHEQGLVHRDIKPSNFMIDKKGKVKLLDFGIAKNTDSTSSEYTQTGTGMQMGTPMYMSPEQITETKSVTPQSDIYSMGVVLWQFVTGEKPYNTATLSTFQLQVKIVNEPLALTGTRFDSVIKNSTEKEPSLRFEDCNRFKYALENLSLNTVIEKTVLVNSDEKTILNSTNDYTVLMLSPLLENTTIPAGKLTVTANDKSINTINGISEQFKTPKEYFTFLFKQLDEKTKAKIKWDITITNNDFLENYCVAFSVNNINFVITDKNELFGFDWYLFYEIYEEFHAANFMYIKNDSNFGVDINLTDDLRNFIFSITDNNSLFFDLYKTTEPKSIKDDWFNRQVEKFNLKEKNKNSKLYFYPEIPEKKRDNFLISFRDCSRIISKIDKLLLLYDDTLFGKCDEGLAIILTTDQKLLLLISGSGQGEKGLIYTLNYHDRFIDRISEISITGFWGSTVNITCKSHTGEIYKRDIISGIKNGAKEMVPFIMSIISFCGAD